MLSEFLSNRTPDAFRSTITRAEVKPERKMRGRSGSLVGEANNGRACIGERVGFPTIWIISLLLLAVVLVCGESASAEAVHKRMMIATRNCRSAANTFMIKVKNTRCSFLGQEKSNIFMKKCSMLASRVEDSYVLA
jgi:hypothetical protein